MYKLEWTIKEIEDAFNIKLLRNKSCIGVDTASKTGISIVNTTDKNVIFSINLIDIDVSKIKDKEDKDNLRYSAIYNAMTELIRKDYIVVPEQVFFGVNVGSLITLARLGGIVYAVAKSKGCEEIRWLSAVQARSKLGINQKNTNKKITMKQAIMQRFNEKMKSKITDDNLIDAMILSICGIIDNKPEIKKKRKR